MLNDTVLAFIGLGLTAMGLFYTGYQIRSSKKVARGEFLLHLDEMFKQHNQTHIRLRPSGDWGNGKTGTSKSEEWVSVEQYMGLFERVNVLIEDKIIDIDTIDRLYGYRVINILNNEIIKQAKLERESNSWQDFIELGQKIKQIRRNRSKWRYRLLKFIRLK